MHGVPGFFGESSSSVMSDASDRGMLLAGLVVDAAGLAMTLSRRTATGAIGSRYYASPPSPSSERTGQRVPAARLDRCVVGVLSRVGLLDADWQPADLAAILRCVVVYPDFLELLLNSRPSLAVWRAQQPKLARASVAKVLGGVEIALAPDEELHEVGTTLCLTTPRYSRNRWVRSRNRAATRSTGKEGAHTLC